MTEYYEEQPIVKAPVQPQKYNIVLTRNGDEVQFDFAPATAEMITRFGYIIPSDSRCKDGLISDEDEIQINLAPVIGKNFMGQLAFHTQTQTLFLA